MASYYVMILLHSCKVCKTSFYDSTFASRIRHQSCRPEPGQKLSSKTYLHPTIEVLAALGFRQQQKKVGDRLQGKYTNKNVSNPTNQFLLPEKAQVKMFITSLH
jgi:hypothetical protein